MSSIPRIDEYDQVIGKTTIFQAKKNGWMRRISRVFIFDHDGNILLQRRGQDVSSYPNLLDQAAGGHVDFGETYLEAAYRELKEELGLSAVPLKEIAVSYRNQDCFEGIYKGKIDSSTDFILNTKEVSGILWMPVAEFDKQVGNSSDIVPVLYVVWRDFKKQLLA